SIRASGAADAADRIARAVYCSLHELHDLAYDYEPPCWESSSQRVRFPDEVLVDGKGTCIDLALLVTAVLENALWDSAAQPLLLLVPGHALVGCWRRPTSRQPVIADAK